MSREEEEGGRKGPSRLFVYGVASFVSSAGTVVEPQYINITIPWNATLAFLSVKAILRPRSTLDDRVLEPSPCALIIQDGIDINRAHALN